MDSVTQAALGASVGQVVLGKQIGNKAAIIGAVIGTVPDLDVFLMPFFSELQRISLHRGYSHSVLFCVLGAFLAAYLLSRFRFAREVSNARLWVCCFLVLTTHIILDVFTTYGTQVFLPFTDSRISLDSISIIDPVYTLPLIIGLFISIRSFRKQMDGSIFYAKVGLAVSTIYLVLTFINKQHIERVFTSQLSEEGIHFSDLLTVPVTAGNMVWYGVGKSDNSLHIGKYSVLSNNKVEFHEFPINDHLIADLDKELVHIMKWFAQGFYTVAEKDGALRLYNMQCDMQGVRMYDDYKAPTKFYYEIIPNADGTYELSSAMHK